jgi:hypothetical protein
MQHLLLFHSNNGKRIRIDIAFIRTLRLFFYFLFAIRLHGAAVNVISKTPTKMMALPAHFRVTQKWLRERASVFCYMYITYFLYAKLHNVCEKLHRP